MQSIDCVSHILRRYLTNGFRCDFQFFLIGFLRADIGTRYKTFTENLLFPIRGFVALESAISLLHHSDLGRSLGVQMKTVYYEEQSIPKRTEIKNLKATELKTELADFN